MKKVLFSIIIAATFLSCKKNVDPLALDTTKCTKELEEYEKSVTVWLNDPENKPNCEAFKKSLNRLLKECSYYTPAQRKLYEDQIKDLTCE
jgi:hypothetical protein